MGLFQWFDTREVDEFVRTVAEELVKRVPPDRLESTSRKAAERLRNTHDAIFARAGKFARMHPLNLYKKARLGNEFRWTLKEAGYPPDFVEAWTHELVTLVALNTASGKPAGG